MTEVISQAALQGKQRKLYVTGLRDSGIAVSVDSHGGDYIGVSFHLSRDDAIALRDLLDDAIAATRQDEAA